MLIEISSIIFCSIKVLCTSIVQNTFVFVILITIAGAGVSEKVGIFLANAWFYSIGLEARNETMNPVKLGRFKSLK